VQRNLSPMKKLLSVRELPYLYFIAGTGFWFIMDFFNGGKINLIALLVLAFLIGQMLYKSNVLGLCFSTISMVFSIMMFYAVLSELKEFQQFTSSALQLVTVGSLLNTSSFFMGVLIFKSHLKGVQWT
jgi:hypothetical protein